MIVLIIGLLLGFVALIFLVTSRAGSPWMPTSCLTRRQMLNLLDLKKGEILVDLGAGDGRILIDAARNYGTRAIGYEVNPLLVWVGRLRAILAGVGEQVEIRQENLFKADLTEADAVTMFLMPATHARVAEELLPQCRSGTRFVCYAFPLGERLPQQIIRAPRSGRAIYLYVK